MEICVIGTGYVGLTTGTVLASRGHNVHCVDINEDKIQLLNNGRVPIYEPGLDKMIEENYKNDRLSFSTKIEEKIQASEIIILAVGTPPLADGSTDLTFIKNAVEMIKENLNSYKIIVIKSTVPPGTNEWVQSVLSDAGVDASRFDVVSNPEFLKEGTAIQDLLHPDKTVIGAKSEHAIQKIKQMYAGIEGEFIVTSPTGAELIKYASNAFLATKISFINEMARICDVYHVNINDVAKGIGTDPRIGALFLKAGLGYGGSCFPKDISSLYHSAKRKNVATPLLEATMLVNETQVDVYINKLKANVSDLADKKITVWGMTYKPDTDDTRLSQSIALLNKLSVQCQNLHTFDPLVKYEAANISAYTDPYESVKDADILIIATNWDTFHTVDWARIRRLMKGNILLDARNMFEPSTMTKYGFNYIGIAR